MASEVDRIAALSDPIELIKAATQRLNEAQREVTDLARLRRRTIQELHDSGLSYAQIADAAGLSRGRIHQVRHSGPPPEGFFLGDGAVVVITPLKQDAIQSRPVVAVEDVAAAQQLGELAGTLGMDYRSEHVQPDGQVDLNRPNLVVICGPRISPAVAATLDQDDNIKFERAADGPWTLHDLQTGAVYRSGWDFDPAEPYDFAYFGRLRRPDNEGSVMIFTGIHPPGSLGVVHFIRTQIADLYETLKTRQFSAILRITYDPTTHEPIEVRPVSPYYEPRTC